MKRIITILMAFLLAILLAGCKDSKPEENDLSFVGKYTSSSSSFRNPNRPYVDFKEDGTFSLFDMDNGALKEIKGKYTYNEGLLILTPDDVTNEATYIFEVNGSTDLKLKSDVISSKVGDTFTTKEIVEINNEPDEFEGTFYNQTNGSSAVFNKDGTFSITEIEGMGACLITGTYEEHNGHLVLTATQSDIADKNGNPIKEISFEVVDRKNLILTTDLQPSKSGDEYKTTWSGNDATDIVIEGPNGAPELEHTVYVNEINVMGMTEPYLPYIEFDSAGMFTFVENFGEGMCKYTGGWDKSDGYYTCVVDQNPGPGLAEMKTIKFKIVDDKTIRLEDDVIFSNKGDTFILHSLDYLEGK